MTPDEIKKTRLYRTLAPKIRKQDREEFARMLALVPKRSTDNGPGMGGEKLSAAFLWHDTPQGDGYWSQLYFRLQRHHDGPAHQLPEDFQP